MENFFPWQYWEGCPFRQKGGCWATVQVQNSSHAWARILLLSHPLKKIPRSKMSFTERSATPSRNPSPRQLDHSAEILHSSMHLIFATTPTPTKNVVRGDHSGEVSDSDSDSESGPGSCPDSDLHKESNSGSEHSSEKCKVSLKQSYNFINYLNPITWLLITAQWLLY